MAGAALGLLFACWGVAFLRVAAASTGIPRLDDVRVDGDGDRLHAWARDRSPEWSFGLVPAFHATRGAVRHALKEGGRGAVTSRGGARMRGALVVVEMALAVMLLAGAGLLMRSFMRLQAVDPGFKPAQTLSFELSLPDVRYEEDAATDRVLRSAAAAPARAARRPRPPAR